jgi:type VI secretion system secreted protein Hcp
MWIENESGSPIEGSVQISDDREGSIEVYALEHGIENPTDEHTGSLNGVRRHKAVNITKMIDMSSPELFRSVTSGRTLKKVMLRFYNTNDEGKEQEYYRVEYENVKLCNFETCVPNVKFADSDRLPHLEKISMRYEKITVTFAEGNRTASDSWKERKGSVA